MAKCRPQDYRGKAARIRKDGIIKLESLRPKGQTNILKTFFLVALIFGFSTGQNASTKPDDTLEIRSPNRRFIVRFSEPQSDEPGELWGMITVRDVRAGRERIVRRAEGRRGEGNFESFSPLDPPDAWSPDGLFLAYWDDFCADEPAVKGGVVCHIHEIRFLSMNPLPPDTEELSLGRYSFGGWSGHHTVLEILVNEDGRKVKRNPVRKRRG